MKTNTLILGGLALLLAAQTTFAFSTLRSRIPNGTTHPSPASCMVCHDADGPPLNDFGADFDAPPSGTSRQWSTVLAMLDSDGDGYSNGAELGDPNGTWVAGQANPPGPIFDPGDPNSHPTTANVPPTATLTGPANGATFIAPASVALTANAADSDGTVTQVQFLNGTTVLGTDTSAPYSFAWNNVPAGSYVLTARATDNGGASTTSAAVSITVNPAQNVPPTATLTGPANGATFTAPASIALTANATDSDGTVAQVQFLNGTTVLGTDTSAPYSFAWNNVPAGSYTLTARATDNGGASATSAAVSITVNAAQNVPPTASLTSPANGATFTAPASVTLTANAADADGTVTQVQFLNGTTVLGTDTSAPYTFAWNNVPAGSYALSARATDNGGASTTSAAVSITVNAAQNAPPTASLTSPANGAMFSAPASVALAANAADSDGTVTQVQFLNGTTVIGTDTTAPYSFAWNGVAAGTYSLSSRATDNSGATTLSAAVSITVNPPLNVPPTASLTAPANGATFTAPANVALDANATDGDGTITLVEFLSGTTVIGTDATAPYSFAWNGVAAGNYTLSARATDNSGATTTSAIVMITVNGAVVAPTITQHPESRSVDEGETVTFQVAATGSVPLSFQWQKNGANLSNGGNISGATSTVLTVANVTSADAGSYRAVVSNAANQPATSDAAVLAITSEPPPLTITLTSPANGATFTAPADVLVSAEVSPSDNIASVEFYEGTNLIVTLTAAPFAVTVTNVPEGSYVFTALVTDGNNATAASTPVTIQVVPPGANLPPVVNLLRPEDGDRFRSGRNIVLVAETTDADGTVQSVEFFAGTESLGLATLVQRDDDNDDEGENRDRDDDDGEDGEDEDEEENGERAALWVLTWSNAPVGDHQLTAVATDNLGATTTSAAVAVTVQAPPPPRVRITAPDSSASIRETSVNTATFEVRRDNGVNGDLVVNYTITGTATNGINYLTLPGTVTIPAGERSVRFQVVPLPQVLPPNQSRLRLTVVLTVSPSESSPPAYVVENRPARVTITYQAPRGDDDDDD